MLKATITTTKSRIREAVAEPDMHCGALGLIFQQFAHQVAGDEEDGSVLVGTGDTGFSGAEGDCLQRGGRILERNGFLAGRVIEFQGAGIGLSSGLQNLVLHAAGAHKRLVSVCEEENLLLQHFRCGDAGLGR